MVHSRRKLIKLLEEVGTKFYWLQVWRRNTCVSLSGFPKESTSELSLDEWLEFQQVEMAQKNIQAEERMSIGRVKYGKHLWAGQEPY